MSSVTLDQSVVDKLKDSGDRVQILDPQGNVIGTFRPKPRVYKYGEIPELSEEEWKKRFSGENCITTAEVLRRLGQS